MKKPPFRLFCLIWILAILAALIPAAQAQEQPTPPPLPATLSPGRGGAFALQWRSDGEVLVIGGSKGLWFLDRAFNFIGHTNKFGATGYVEWSPDGHYLATAHFHVEAAFVIIWRSEPDGRLVDIKRFDVSAYSMVWHPFSPIISINDEIIDLITDERSKPFQTQSVSWIDDTVFETSQAGLVFAWSPDGQRVVHLSQVGGSSSAIYGVFDVQNGEHLFDLEGRIESGNRFEWSSDGEKIVTGYAAWDAQTGTNLAGEDNHIAVAKDAIMSQDGERVATLTLNLGYTFGTLYYRDTEKGDYRAWDYENDLTDIDWYPDSDEKIITALTELGYLVTIDTLTGEILESYPLFDTSYNFAWSPDGNKLAATTSYQGLSMPIRVWDIGAMMRGEQPTTEVQIIGADFYVDGRERPDKTWSGAQVAWNQDGRSLYTERGKYPIFNKLHTVDQWDAITGEYMSRIVTVGAYPMPDFSYSPDYRFQTRFFTLIDELDDFLTVMDVPTQNTLWSYAGYDVVQAAWCANNRYLAIVDHDGIGGLIQTSVWDMATRQRLLIVDVGGGYITWNPQCTTLSVTPYALDQTALVDIATGTVQPQKLPGGAVTWSPNGRVMAIGKDKTLHFYSVETREQTSYTTRGSVDQIAWSPNGRWIAFTGNAGLQVLDVRRIQLP